MWRDPVVEETRGLRDKYAAGLNHDPDAIYDDIRNRQKTPGRKVVSLPSRRPKSVKKTA